VGGDIVTVAILEYCGLGGYVSELTVTVICRVARVAEDDTVVDASKPLIR
jgi:hypothetical protein